MPKGTRTRSARWRRRSLPRSKRQPFPKRATRATMPNPFPWRGRANCSKKSAPPRWRWRCFLPPALKAPACIPWWLWAKRASPAACGCTTTALPTAQATISPCCRSISPRASTTSPCSTWKTPSPAKTPTIPPPKSTLPANAPKSATTPSSTSAAAAWRASARCPSK